MQSFKYILFYFWNFAHSFKYLSIQTTIYVKKKLKAKMKRSGIKQEVTNLVVNIQG